MVTINWTPDKKEEVILTVEKYILKCNATCGETVQQSDRCQVEAIELFSDLADVIALEDSE